MKKYKINKSKCVGCGACVGVCPHQAINIEPNGKAIIDQEKCQGCGVCIEACSFNAIEEILKKEITQEKISPALPYKPFSPSENFSFFNEKGKGRGTGAGRGRGFGAGPRDGRGEGKGGGGRNR